MVQVTTDPAEKSPDHPTNIIQFRPRPKPQPRLMSQMIGVPSFTFDGFDPRETNEPDQA